MRGFHIFEILSSRRMDFKILLLLLGIVIDSDFVWYAPLIEAALQISKCKGYYCEPLFKVFSFSY